MSSSQPIQSWAASEYQSASSPPVPSQAVFRSWSSSSQRGFQASPPALSTNSFMAQTLSYRCDVGTASVKTNSVHVRPGKSVVVFEWDNIILTFDLDLSRLSKLLYEAHGLHGPYRSGVREEIVLSNDVRISTASALIKEVFHWIGFKHGILHIMGVCNSPYGNDDNNILCVSSGHLSPSLEHSRHKSNSPPSHLVLHPSGMLSVQASHHLDSESKGSRTDSTEDGSWVITPARSVCFAKSCTRTELPVRRAHHCKVRPKPSCTSTPVATAPVI